MRNARAAAVVYLTLLVVVGGLLAHQRASAASIRTAAAGAPICRYGVNATGGSDVFTDHDLTQLRIGWYLNYEAQPSPNHPAGVRFVPIIRLTQVGVNGFSYTPNGPALLSAIAASPGAAWLIGNEPDRPGPSQDDVEPHVYAAAYHELYGLIKAADPTARIFAGTIVQPTPVRLMYLDLVLTSYHQTFGQAMPVDGWSIHNFILNEVSCAHNPDCWGAEVPPGVDAPHGEIISIDQSDDFNLFTERIVRFRNWMKQRGYGDRPLYVTEYGILMPPDYGFDANRVNLFMTRSFDYMTSATDPNLGYAADGYRLVQEWSWYSTNDDYFNGWLFDTATRQLSAMGQNFANYTGGIAITNDLHPWRLATNPASPFTQGGPVAVQLRATIANSGNPAVPAGPAVVRFYQGDPAQGGTQIGGDQVVNLAGCGALAVAGVTWNSAPAGMHRIFVVVDPAGSLAESDETNNTREFPLLIATQQTFIPRVAR
ncbi:conserved exported protein of unknown function [Candidatus Promineifilum breve]|uniref:CARDB domain-containing protein n=1 Tax=Candidatus Promineifilum breve TaxID=1806508 RepID=A0A160SZ26_9CHLR|nr:CARDB domain-containing protein [Candidatus Promineifilum breve]CUS02791.2 conserved exported protein of unknown function [Candidatus Promineifilum breve]